MPSILHTHELWHDSVVELTTTWFSHRTEKVILTILEQNYFCCYSQYSRQTESSGMCIPTSAILAEIYLQCLEDSNIYKLLIKHKLLGYLEHFQYVDSFSACMNTACSVEHLHFPYAELTKANIAWHPIWHHKRSTQI
jgi:hypothetical protein